MEDSRNCNTVRFQAKQNIHPLLAFYEPVPLKKVKLLFRFLFWRTLLRSIFIDVDGQNVTALRRSIRHVIFNEKTPNKKKKIAMDVSTRVLRQRVSRKTGNGLAISRSAQIIKSETLKTKKSPLPNKKSRGKITVDFHECDGCQNKFQSESSVLKHKYYCPKNNALNNGRNFRIHKKVQELYCYFPSRIRGEPFLY